MCEANAYIVKANEKILLMESVDKAVQEGNGNWHLVSIFGEQKRIAGRINSMNLVNHEIIFEEIDD
jgi:predicted RNA-binding protein